MHQYVIVDVFTTIALQGNPWPSSRTRSASPPRGCN